MKRIALFGGSFDPVHSDHINIIKSCKENLNFDEVWIMPAYVNPFKTLSTSSVTQRLDMLKIAVKDLDYVKVKTYEISKQTSSFTYDTVKYYKTKYPEISFSFVMGSDQLDNFEKWDHFNQLIKEIDFKVFLRKKDFNQKIVDKYNLQTFEFENNFLSSTKIRNLVDLNLQIKEVNDYVNNNLMYLYERVENKMDEKRYFHSLNVGQMAMELARLNNYDLNKALIAGTLHDIAKRWSEPQMKEYLKKYNKELLKEPKPTWHSFVGAFHLKHDWLFSDKEIIQAVYNHTVGSKDMSILDMIVFCADKISSERDYDGVERLRALVKSDLLTGFKELLKNQYEIAVKKHSKTTIGKGLTEAYNFWIMEKN
ncbi:nicotinic acid mononucleotide adenylyltransferase [Spiroplasma cantharicola]|uniref:Probable nicotinate-nucleotide adenylyltransferase n=2 Tax=Spiroplasma cantharicola TaxID=362837 RepID=A0A0M5KCE0_9MOLU|nr:nicotinate-nucleotide adenylyltransferase [Spiroplasma cantharicola]ALD66613.1 nicotinic acid mononucleotide adenylyltransferase [Spiroplasma cantharicola]